VLQGFTAVAATQLGWSPPQSCETREPWWRPLTN